MQEKDTIMGPSETAQKRGEWIWIHTPNFDRLGLIPRGELEFSKSTDANRFVYFRKRVKIPKSVKHAYLRVSADGRYLIFLNGVVLGRGPSRCHPDWQYVDSYDISMLLRPGQNIIAALVHSYGRDMSWYQTLNGGQSLLFPCGGFFLEAEIEGVDKEICLYTDTSWKYMLSNAWKEDVPFSGTGYFEDFDAKKEPRGWQQLGFDDSNWPNAIIQRLSLPQGGADIIPFPRLVERDIAPMRTENVFPVAEFHNLDNESIVYDFGRILLGRIAIEVEAKGDVSLELSYSESLGIDNQILKPEAIIGISNPIGARMMFSKGRTSHVLFEPAGFRYVQLNHIVASIEILSVWAEESSYSGGPSPLSFLQGTEPNDAGYFSCSDPILSDIWKAGAYTAAICRQDGFIDCPSREQRQWTGDTYIQSLIHYVTCADWRLPRKTILQVAQTQRSDGMVAMASTSDLARQWRTYIPDYALLWVIAIYDYIDYSGDASILEIVFPTIAKVMDWFLPWINNCGLLFNVPGWIFIDWSELLDKKGAVLVLNALYSAAARVAAKLAEITGDEHRTKCWAEISDSIISKSRNYFWDEKRSVYADSRTDQGLSCIVSQQANAAAIAFGIAPPERYDRILSSILDINRLKLTKTWAWDIERPFNSDVDIIMAQPYFCRFLHAALEKAGRLDELIANVRNCWSPMLKSGGTTFWESWQRTQMTSLCHAFSATPTYDLSTYILGIKPTSPGFSHFEVTPYFGNLQWARGRMPTPRGPISLAWQRKDRVIDIEIQAPNDSIGTFANAKGENWTLKSAKSTVIKPGLNQFSLIVASNI